MFLLTSDSVPAKTFQRLCRMVRKVSRFGSAQALETNSKCAHAAPNKTSTDEPKRAPFVDERLGGSSLGVIALGSLEAVSDTSASGRLVEGQRGNHATMAAALSSTAPFMPRPMPTCKPPARRAIKRTKVSAFGPLVHKGITRASGKAHSAATTVGLSRARARDPRTCSRKKRAVGVWRR